MLLLQEGLATIVVAVAAYWFIYNYPDTASFLTEKERIVIQARLSADSDSTHNEVFTWGNVTKALKDPKCWLYGFAFHTMSLPLYTYSLFLVCKTVLLSYRLYGFADRDCSQVSSSLLGTQQLEPNS